MIRPITASALSGAGFSLGVQTNGRTTVPVQKSGYIYSHFKHVSGIPAPEGVNGVSVNKLKILDTLIERLSQIKKNHIINGDTLDRSMKNEKRIDALITSLQKELAAASAVPYMPHPQIPSGSFVNISI